MKVTKFLTIERAVEEAKKLSFKHFCDEHCHLKCLDYFVIIFYSKYSLINESCFTFWLEKEVDKYFIVANSITGFQYKFPLS